MKEGSLKSNYKTSTDPPLSMRSVILSKKEIKLLLTLFVFEPALTHRSVSFSQLSDSHDVSVFLEKLKVI